ncbi:reverse transcriptase domain-containing protein [Tanacetum coccineum]|uniref:Reverse transcriptase domain-containing protein n=1 Tax=Tanacetum coccineum TaxID=301880 RepID=A0ABQ4ZYX7_9ASTR
MGIVVSTIHGAIKFHMPKGIGTLLSENSSQGLEKEQQIASEVRQADKEDILICVDAEEKIVTTAHMTGVSRTIIVEGEIFNTEHRVNEFKHVEPVKQKKRSMAPNRNEAIHTQKLCIDFTDINKACPKENHPLPATESKVENIHRNRFKCFLDAYKGHHQILIDEKDEEKAAFYTREGVFFYKRLPFGLKNAGATFQRLIDKVFSYQAGRKMEVNDDEMVIKSDSEEEMLADIKETLKRLRVINLKLDPKKCSF